MRFTTQFYGGLLMGLGLGLMLGAVFVELEWLTLQHKAWTAFPGALCVAIGGMLARKSPASV
jgi:hypothetical protein